MSTKILEKFYVFSKFVRPFSCKMTAAFQQRPFVFHQSAEASFSWLFSRDSGVAPGW